MSYVNKNLLHNEQIVHKSHRHWIIFSHPAMWLTILLLLFQASGWQSFIWILTAVFTLTLLSTSIDYITSEIVITNMRVLVKVGLFYRQSLETMLQNIATIKVEQSLLGRILNYGTVRICDTGDNRTPFAYIHNPLGFRRIVQQSIDQRFPAPQ